MYMLCGVVVCDRRLSNVCAFSPLPNLVSNARSQLKFSSTVKKWNRIMGHGGNIAIESTYVSGRRGPRR